jgi:protein-export membrane protein SecD
MSTLRFRWAVLVVVLLVAGYYLLPTFRFYRMDPAQQGSSDPSVAGLRENSMRLGLDLQGGAYLVYEVDLDKIPEDQRSGDEVDRAIEIIRNRVDQFGVTEPVIQKQGNNRIVVQLPGLESPEQVRDMVGKTARLEFRLVRTPEEMQQALSIVDRAIARRQGGQAAVGDTAAGADSLALGDAASAADSLLAADKPFSSLLQVAPSGAGGMVYVPAGNLDEVESMWHAVAFDSVRNVPRPLAGGTVLLFGESIDDPGTANPGRYLYALSARPELSGSNIEDATVAFGLEPQRPQAAGVSLNFDKRGAATFTRLTGANVGRQLGIVLDNVVRSAPVIQDKIRGGRASITGISTDNEARMLGIVLRAGALPTDLVAIEERTVGPTLGRDSINQGVRAALLGLGLVVLVIVFWYRASGLLAVLALGLNLLFLFSVLGAIRGTLTLPGIAGIVLTIGMAVDANVLVFERIREELRTGKTVRGAVDEGYRRALVTILDSNLTTLISSVVLFQFGTGPIRGFALTLMVGIIANLFTAVFVTRLIYDSFMAKRQLKGLSI